MVSNRPRRSTTFDRRSAHFHFTRDMQGMGASYLTTDFRNGRIERGVERRVVGAEADVCHLRGRAHDGLSLENNPETAT